MAVELRCPDCRAKLRLAEAPDAGTEVECPKCGTAFPAPEPEADESEAPLKKKKKPLRDSDEDADAAEAEAKTEKKEKKPKSKGPVDPKAPKKRKAKKRETSNTTLIAVIGAGLVLLTFASGVLIYFFTRTAKSVEMMYYLPEDCETAQGVNLGHAQKYPEFYKSLSTSFTNTEFKAGGDALAKVLGAKDMDDLADYVVFGASEKGNTATVFRTKVEFDAAGLAKLSGAQAKTLDGKTYYVADGFKGGPKLRVFAPTNRLIVYCPAEVPEAVFKKMLSGNADNREKTIGVRGGDLSKRITRGTFWQFEVYDGTHKPPAAPAAPSTGAGGSANVDDGKSQFERLKVDTLTGSKGMGMKASIGSREVRFEIVVWCASSEKSTSLSRKHRESDLGKGDEGTPPRWWKENIDNIGSKKIAAQMLANIGCGSSGELFYAQSAVESVDLKDSLSGFTNKFSNTGGPGAGQPGMPGGPLPGGGPQPRPRRRAWARR